MSVNNLLAMYDNADALDKRDGMRAYMGYHDLLLRLATKYEADFARTVAAFAALSPNNDYVGNLRSLVTLLDLKQRDGDLYRGTVSTYKHCRDRAIKYLTGQADFMGTVKGPKIRAFYQNILDPTLHDPVTIDGHMVAIWKGMPNMKMKEAMLTPTLYRVIAEDVREVAGEYNMLPHQMQATLWFARKRVHRIKYSPQLDMLGPMGQGQRVTFDLDHVIPFAMEGSDA